MSRAQTFKTVLFAIVPGIALLIGARFADPVFVRTLTYEDGLIESFSAIFYLFAFLLCGYRLFFARQKPRAVLILWMALCFLFFGEETSWLQRVVGYETPAGIDNAQGEFNIHNLRSTQLIIGVTESQYPLLGSQNLFRYGFISYFILLPLLARSKKLNFIRNLHAYPLPSREFVISVASLIIITLAFSMSTDSRIIKSSIGEIHEFFYAFIILLYVARNLRNPVSDLEVTKKAPHPQRAG